MRLGGSKIGLSIVPAVARDVWSLFTGATNTPRLTLAGRICRALPEMASSSTGTRSRESRGSGRLSKGPAHWFYQALDQLGRALLDPNPGRGRPATSNQRAGRLATLRHSGKVGNSEGRCASESKR